MTPFLNKNFVHRWSATEDYNTAVMGLKLNSRRVDKIYKAIFKNIHRTGLNLVDGFYPTRIRDTIKKLNNGNIFNYIDLKVYHSVVFDPAWLCNDGKNYIIIILKMR